MPHGVPREGAGPDIPEALHCVLAFFVSLHPVTEESVEGGSDICL